MRRRGATEQPGLDRLERAVGRGTRDAPRSRETSSYPDPESDSAAANSHRLSTRGWDARSLRAFAVVLTALLIIAGWWWWSGRAQVPAAITELIESGAPLIGEQVPGGAISQESGAPSQVVVVHVAGEVREPGLVELPWGSRVSDAVAAAGGAKSPDALTSVNLARPVIDGEQIILGSAAEQQSDGRISINSASSVELQELPGVGPVLAERIVAFREQNGPFISLDGLLEVSGIGEAVLRNMSEQVRM